MARIKWLPYSRDEILKMAQVWENVTSIKGAAWNIPNTVIAELHDRFTEAKAAYEAAAASERTQVLTARINEAFAKLEACMRDMKDRYFKTPPLLNEDLISLLLKPRDGVMTTVPRPRSHPLIILSYEGYNSVVLNISVMLGENVPLDSHVEVFRGVMPQGGATLEEAAGPKRYLMRPPSSGEDLFKLIDTKRKRETIGFPPEEGGKVAYFCARYVNEKGEAGPWGPVAGAIILRADNPLGAGASPTPP